MDWSSDVCSSDLPRNSSRNDTIAPSRAYRNALASGGAFRLSRFVRLRNAFGTHRGSSSLQYRPQGRRPVEGVPMTATLETPAQRTLPADPATEPPESGRGPAREKGCPYGQ